MDVSAHIVVNGFVQGVGFRYFVLHQAMNLGLKGFVENEMNGDVRIVAVGERSLIEELLTVVKIGPRSAQVREVRVQWEKPDHHFERFEIR